MKKRISLSNRSIASIMNSLYLTDRLPERDKAIIFRTWQTDYRGNLLICTSARKEPVYHTLMDRLVSM